jgi:hypothetical protein
MLPLPLAEERLDRALATGALIPIHGRRLELAGPACLRIRAGLNGLHSDHFALRTNERVFLVLRAPGRGATRDGEGRANGKRGQCRRASELMESDVHRFDVFWGLFLEVGVQQRRGLEAMG